MNKKILFFLFGIVLLGCQKNNPEEQLEHLTGYWEIDRVEISEDSVINYKINATVDYMEFDGNKGYWFKVSEDFEFNFSISDEDLTRSSTVIKKYPEGMEYVQSMNQAFYFVEDIIIDGNSAETGSWILAYNGDVLAGIRQWQGGMVRATSHTSPRLKRHFLKKIWWRCP